MLIRQTDPTACKTMDSNEVEGVKIRVMVGREDGAPTFAMRHITIEPGGYTPHHQHNYEHQVMVLKGTGEAFDEGRTHVINAGDVIFVEPDAEHQFRNTSEEPLEIMCLVPLHGACGTPVPGS